MVSAEDDKFDGFSEEDASRARELLSEFGFESSDNTWGEEQRFGLYDQLSKLAFELADDAMKSNGETADQLFKESNVAMCAMKIVSEFGPFSEEVLQKARGGGSG